MNTVDLDYLNSRFGLADELRFSEGPGGRILVTISNSGADARLILQGAQLVHWQPRDHAPVLWLSSSAKYLPGKSVRGGIPVCWPWFGPHSGADALPAHGFARTTPWEVLETGRDSTGSTRILMHLIRPESSVDLWPSSASLELQVRVGKTLELDLVTKNLSPAPIRLSQALHSYFAISDIEDVTVSGLNGCTYFDKLDGNKRKQQSGDVRVDGEVDRVYLDAGQDCVIHDPGHRRQIRIQKSGSRSTVVWNPWDAKAARLGDFDDGGFRRMICVETANAADDVREIAPGAEHRLSVRYSVESEISS